MQKRKSEETKRNETTLKEEPRKENAKENFMAKEVGKDSLSFIAFSGAELLSLIQFYSVTSANVFHFKCSLQNICTALI